MISLRKRYMKIFGRSVSILLLLAILLPATATTVFAFNYYVYPTHNEHYTDIYGQTIQVTGDLNVTGWFLNVLPGNATFYPLSQPGYTTSTPATFGSTYAVGMNTTVTDWVLQFVISTTATTPPNAEYTITFYSGQYTGVQAFYAQTQASGLVSAGQSLNVYINLGPVLQSISAFNLKIAPTAYCNPYC